MKILFATGKLNTILSATHKIAYQIAKQLQQNGHQCFICGFSDDIDETIISDNDIQIFHLNSPLAVDMARRDYNKFCAKAKTSNKNDIRKKYVLQHPFKSFLISYSNSKYFNSDKRAIEYAKRAKEIITTQNIDIVVSFYRPFKETFYLCNLLEGIVPVCLYQADPWGLHRLPGLAQNTDLHIQQETSIFEISHHIITTPALYQLYKQNPFYSYYVNKMTVANFPNIKPAEENSEESVFCFDADYTNLLFCGLLEDEYRSPEKFLQTVSELLADGEKIKVNFLGTSTSKTLQSFCEKYPQNVLHHEAVSFKRAAATMAKADFLLNLSNTLDNQVPSKIFDYFSIGKPVVNVQKITNCPSREYFDRYPLAFTFEDFAPDKNGLKDFLAKTKGKKEKYETVKELFKDATIEYVAEQTEKVLTDILNDK